MSFAFGISFGDVSVLGIVPGVVGATGGATGVDGAYAAAELPHGSQTGPQPEPHPAFFVPQRAFSASNRLGRFATLVPHEPHDGAAYVVVVPHPQADDLCPRPPMRLLSRSKRPGLELPQQPAAEEEYADAYPDEPQLVHPVPLTTTGAGAATAGPGIATGSAPTSAADVMTRKAAFM
jgi:hypothetical protein